MNNQKKLLPYYFGGIKEFNLKELENEIAKDHVYLDVFSGSDRAFKREISPLKEGLQTINKLKTIKYRYKTEQFKKHHFPPEEQKGLIADELEKEFPLAVYTDGEGHQYINYASLAPLLINAVNELHHIVEQQQQRIQSLENLLQNK